MGAERQRQLAERACVPRDLDAVVRQDRRALVVPHLEGDDATLPQPAKPLLGRDLVAREPPHCFAARNDGTGVVLVEGDERIQEQVGGGDVLGGGA